jgi:multidrug efflux pump subunit AcrA (membrane-fusion protein)
MTAAEQQALARARARIERNLAEVACLARQSDLPPREFYRRFLELTLESVEAMGGAVWSVDQGRAHRAAEVSFASSGYESERQKRWVDQLLSHTVATSRPSVVAVQDQSPTGEDVIGNEVPYPFFYTPVVLDGQTRLVLQVWLKHAGDPRGYADIAAFLEGLAQQACFYLRGVQQAALLQRDANSQRMLRLQEELLGELNPEVLCTTTANYLVDLLGCSLAATLRRQGRRWSLVAASNQEVVDARAAQSQSLADLASLLPEATEGAVVPDEARAAAEEEGLRQALAAAGYSLAAWCHLRPSKKAPANLLLIGCWHEGNSGAVAAKPVLAWCAGQLAKASEAATHFQHIPLRPLVSAAGRVIRAWNQDRRRKVLTWVAAPLVLLVAALLFPAPYKIKADCRVVPARTATIVAETDGKIVEVLAPEGATVKAGDVLARLEDADYATQLAIAAQQLSRWRVEAARAQALANEPERKIAELAARREEESMRRLDYLRSRTQLRSPIDGIVLTRSVQHREGEAMETGKVFCEIGSLDSYELQLDLRQQDLGPVLGALGAGEHLPVDFILHAHPRDTLRGELTEVAQVSQLPEMRVAETVFTARIAFPDAVPEGGLKAGYTGKASIVLGRRPWGWLLSRPFRQYWRMNWSL